MMKNKTKKTVVQGTYHLLQRQQPHRIEFSCMAVLAPIFHLRCFVIAPVSNKLFIIFLVMFL